MPVPSAWADAERRVDGHRQLPRCRADAYFDGDPLCQTALAPARRSFSEPGLVRRSFSEGGHIHATTPCCTANLTSSALVFSRSCSITDDLHGLSHRLHSSALDYLGLVPALQRLVNEFSEHHGIAIEFAHDSLPAPLPSDVALCLFRVTEESLTNIAKHSHARSARVHVNGRADGVYLTVADSGTGFDLDSVERRAGLGFVSMRERLRVVRGTVRVDSAPSRGTRIDVWVPATSLVPVATGEASHGAASPAQPSSNVSSA